MSFERYSAPTIDGRAATVQHPPGSGIDEFLVATDIGFSVLPGNGRGRFAMILPFPYVLSNQSNLEKDSFSVAFIFRPNRKGFMLDPDKILLSFADSEFIAPSRVSTFSVSPRNQTPPVDPIALGAGVDNWVSLTFPVPPPDPKRHFSIEIDGLQLDGTYYPMPVVSFTQQKVRKPEMVLRPL